MIDSYIKYYNEISHKTKIFNDEVNDEICCKYGSSRRNFSR